MYSRLVTINFRRLACRLAEAQPTTKRFASLAAVMADGYEPTATPYLFKQAHALWAFKPAEDGDGYVLLRMHEEPDRSMQRDAQAYGESYVVVRGFAPKLHGGRLQLRPGQEFVVEGQSVASPDTDRMLGLGLPNPIYPKPGEPAVAYSRIRMRDASSGAEVIVLPYELSTNLQQIQDNFEDDTVIME